MSRRSESPPQRFAPHHHAPCHISHSTPHHEGTTMGRPRRAQSHHSRCRRRHRPVCAARGRSLRKRPRPVWRIVGVHPISPGQSPGLAVGDPHAGAIVATVTRGAFGRGSAGVSRETSAQRAAGPVCSPRLQTTVGTPAMGVRATQSPGGRITLTASPTPSYSHYSPSTGQRSTASSSGATRSHEHPMRAPSSGHEAMTGAGTLHAAR